MSEDKVEDTIDVTVPAVTVHQEIPVVIGGEKQGVKCCGCCCDYRRAVIIVGIVGICINIYFIVDTIMEWNDEVGNYLMSGGVIGIFFLAFQIVAAIKYNLCMLWTAFFFQLIKFAFDIFEILHKQELRIDLLDSDDDKYDKDEVFVYTSSQLAIEIIVNIIVYALFIYPIVGMILEVKSGIMSAATYPREAHSCCCLRKV